MHTQHLNKLLRDFAHCQAGATGIEYALIAGGISIVIAAGVHGIRDETVRPFQGAADGLSAANGE